LAEALSMYQGPFLDGFHLSGAEEFERWVDGERDWLEREARKAASALAREKEEAGESAAAVSWARRALALNPHDEMAVRELMRLLALSGDRAAAVEAYEAFARALRADLELEPSAETLALARGLREGEAEVKRPGAAQDLGQRRLPEPTPPGPGQERPPRTSLQSWASGAPGAAAAVAAGVVIVLASLGILLFSGRGDPPNLPLPTLPTPPDPSTPWPCYPCGI
jgi:tetratricopeptide (TPR) repeat protein